MTFASLVGTLGALGLVLGLLLLAMRLLRKLQSQVSGPGSQVILDVVQRRSLSAKQGLAVVRIGEKQVVVSVGEGGVRFIADAPPPATDPIGQTPTPSRFSQILRRAVGAAGIAFIAFTLSTSSAVAQTPLTPPVATAPQKQQSAAPATGARLDSMAAKLAPQMQLSIGQEKSGGLKLSGTVGIVIMMGLLTLLPAVILMMTGFTRILIVLQFLRQAIGAQSAPPSQLVAGLSLLLTLFVMAPTIDEINKTALTPWMDGKINQSQMFTEGSKPLREFMLRQTRERDLEVFMKLSHAAPVDSPADVPLVVLTSAFVTSELRVAFQIGFALFLPFIVIDIVVASVLMSMGMMMVPPAMIALPFKLLLFVLVDGWTLVIQGLVQSFA